MEDSSTPQDTVCYICFNCLQKSDSIKCSKCFQAYHTDCILSNKHFQKIVKPKGKLSDAKKMNEFTSCNLLKFGEDDFTCAEDHHVPMMFRLIGPCTNNNEYPGFEIYSQSIYKGDSVQVFFDPKDGEKLLSLEKSAQCKKRLGQVMSITNCNQTPTVKICWFVKANNVRYVFCCFCNCFENVSLFFIFDFVVW